MLLEFYLHYYRVHTNRVEFKQGPGGGIEPILCLHATGRPKKHSSRIPFALGGLPCRVHVMWPHVACDIMWPHGRWHTHDISVIHIHHKLVPRCVIPRQWPLALSARRASNKFQFCASTANRPSPICMSWAKARAKYELGLKDLRFERSTSTLYKYSYSVIVLWCHWCE